MKTSWSYRLSNWRAIRVLGMVLIVCLIPIMYPDETSAIPAFARKYDLTCTACHSKPPRLNPFGEAFHMAGFQIPMVPEGEIMKKRRIGRFTSETDLLNILSVRAAGSLIETHQNERRAEAEIHFPEMVEVYLASTLTDGMSFFFELESESTKIEGIEDGLFEERSEIGIGKEFFVMLDIPRFVRDLADGHPQPDSMTHGHNGGSKPMLMGPMIMIGKIDPSTNFSYPTNRQYLLNVPGKVNEETGGMERFSLTPYAFASKFYGIQTADGKSVEVSQEVLYNTQGDLGADIHLMMMPFMIQGGIMQGLGSETTDANSKKDPYLMARVNFGSRRFISGSLSGVIYWGNDTARVPLFEGSSQTVFVDWLRYGAAANFRYRLFDLYGAILWDKLDSLPEGTRAEFDDRAVGLTLEGDVLISDRSLLSLRYDQLDAGGFNAQKADGKVASAQLRYYLRDNVSFYLRDSYNIEEVSLNPLQNFRNLFVLGVDLDF